MKIGVIGSGDVGKTLASGFLKYNHQVMLGSRTPTKLLDWVATQPGMRVGNFAEAADFGEIIVLSVKGVVAQEALALAGEEKLKNKIVIDTTNPIANSPPINGVLQYFTTLEYSLMERLQTSYPKAHFVKAFNSVGSANMVNPRFEATPTMFICGNDDEAKQVVSKMLKDFGWDAADYGKAESARAIEPLCMLWCIPGFLRNDWSHALKMMT